MISKDWYENLIPQVFVTNGNFQGISFHFDESKFMKSKLKRILTEKLDIQETEFLYRWSDTNGKFEQWYDKCRSKSNTICIVQPENDQIWGMSTDIAWWSKGFGQKGTGKSFIFKYDKQHDEVIIYDHSEGKSETYHAETEIFNMRGPSIMLDGRAFAWIGYDYKVPEDADRNKVLCGERYTKIKEVEIFQYKVVGQ